MNLTQILTKEHQLILSVLTLLHQSREKLETGRFVSGAFFKSAMIFCSGFADQFHHFKEEFLLFGLLSHKKQGALDSAMGALRYQHDQCRQCIVGINRALEGYEKKDEMATTFLLESLAIYVSLLRRHIFQEDVIFFPMAEKALSSQEKTALHEQFEKEQQRFSTDGSTFEKYREMAKTLHQLMDPR